MLAVEEGAGDRACAKLSKESGMQVFARIVAVTFVALCAAPASVLAGAIYGTPGSAGLTDILPDTVTFSFSTTTISGVVTSEAVLDSGTNDVDLFYKVSNSPTSTDGITSLAVTGLYPSQLQATGEGNEGSGISPSLTAFNGGGPTYDFYFQNFAPIAPGTPIAPGGTSVWLELPTNATAVTAGLVAVQDGSDATGPGLSVSPVPLPASCLLLVAALGGLGILGLKPRTA
jgi:hypothetical protein